MGQGGSQPLRYKGSPSPGAVAHSRSLDSVADAGDDDPAFVSARGYDSFVDALDGSPEPAVPCAEGDAEEPPAKPSFAFSGADLFRSLRRGEEHWESIAATLLGSPAGFTLQLPKKVRVFDPFLPSTSISYIRVEKVFPSNTRPLLLSLHGARHRASPPSRLIYKAGDDLRQDVGVLQAFGAMNYAFEVSNTTTRREPRLHRHLRRLRDVGPRRLHRARPRRPLTAVCASDRFSDAQLERLVASAAGSYVGAHVLGVRDRHSDNILLADDGTLFHIDFGHVLDDSVAIDTASFATTPALRQAMGDAVWAKFVGARVAFALRARGPRRVHGRGGARVGGQGRRAGRRGLRAQVPPRGPRRRRGDGEDPKLADGGPAPRRGSRTRSTPSPCGGSRSRRR
ncbi:phosphatidylinositol kinase [Aureococcus anophagefferens]|nr:phosphatidylinositol kinase [Aureococcus anophagefferens]